MKLIINLLFFFFFIVVIGNSQNLLKPKWKFTTGDNLDWSKPEYSDSKWIEIEAGKAWESQGFANYDGFAWYRATVVIPSSLKPNAKKFGGLVLKTGMIDDADYTYFNGELIGKTGELPPNYEGKYNTLREYNIPVEKIIWDKANVIAIRVFDNGGDGGIYGQPISLAVKDLSDYLSTEVDFKEKNRIITGDKEIEIPITVKNSFTEPYKGKIMFRIESDFHEKMDEQIAEISVKKNGAKYIVFKTKKLNPGFYIGTVTIGDNSSNSNYFWFGVNPEQIVSQPDPLPDFKNYWDRAKKELASVDPQYQVTKADKYCTATKDVYLVEMRSLSNVLIRGWLGIPKKTGKYPAILHLQGYTTNMVPEWLYQGDDFVSFGLNIRGHGNSTDNINPGFGTIGYVGYMIKDEEQYIYRGAYMDCIRAIDFLCTRPEVDTAKIAVEGHSQGGGLAFATAALDNQRVKLCVSACPWLGAFKDHIKIRPDYNKEMEIFIDSIPGLTKEQIFKSMNYIDTKNMAAWVKAPVFMAVGLFDEACPPHINFAVYNNIKTPKEYLVYPLSGHMIPFENFNPIKFNWIKMQFGMDIPQLKK